MVPLIYISISEDCRQLIIDGHLELLSKFLVAIHVAGRHNKDSWLAGPIQPSDQRSEVKSEQPGAALANGEGVDDDSSS
jgi:hypothetical protein